MAEMIPDKLPGGHSQGEILIFSILQRLPDDHVVYFEPVIKQRYPDFIVIFPEAGILVIEVKGWRAKEIIDGDLNTIRIKQFGKEIEAKHPIRQAREYMYLLMDRCREHPDSECLLNKTGNHQGKFIFPFGHFASLNNITSEEIKTHNSGDLTEVFTPKKIVTRNQLEYWLDELLSAEQLSENLRFFFDPFWTIPRLTESQINTLRAIIHPEIKLPPKTTASQKKLDEQQPRSVKKLDLKQEQNARSIGRGHRIIYGVAGSGKTIILIARAKLLSSQSPESKILLLCYNVTLAAYLKSILKDYPNVNVKHFDDWAKASKVTRKKEELDELLGNEALGNRLFTALEDGSKEYRKYDAILVDEAQDFEVSWFKCVLEAMKEPYDGDLIIVGDGNQGLYPRGQVNWKEIGINAQGRTIYKKFDLDKNYRNSREIIELATVFTQPSEDDEDSILSLRVTPEQCVRSTGIKPVLVKSRNQKEECTRVLDIVKNLLNGQWFGQQIEALEPEDIGIFYPRKNIELIQKFISSLKEFAPVIWLNETSQSRIRVSEPGIKIQTIHSAKGLQYRAVILMWAHLLPSSFKNSNEETDRRLFYVGLTRPEDFLAISTSAFSKSKFITEIEKSGKAVIA